MTKYLIVYNTGYGDMPDTEEFDTHEEASDYAYQMWRDAAESEAEYYAKELTPELAEEFDLEYSDD